MNTRIAPLLLALAFVCLLAQLGRVPWPVLAFALGGLSYPLLRAWLPLPPRLPKPLTNAVALAGTALLAFTAEAYLDLGLAATLLAFLLGVKALELTNLRDHCVAILLCVFLALIHVFLTPTVLGLGFGLLALLLTQATLGQTFARAHGLAPPAWRGLAAAALRLCLALPLAAFFFVLVPRYEGNLLEQTFRERSGFTDTLTLGSLSRLALDHDVAFRATFQGDPPPPEELYWRGVVLGAYDGVSWSRGEVRYSRRPFTLAVDLTYEILLEPHGETFIYALDLPPRRASGLPVKARLMRDATLRAVNPVNRPLRLTLTRVPPGSIQLAASPIELVRLRELPPDAHPRARELARRLAASLGLTPGQNPDGYARAANDALLTYWRSQGFSYSLAPPDLGPDPLEGFLFSAKTGYCEHFASAHAFLLRAMGVPARVVAGYLGGEQNDVGGFLTVRQSDAHAWVEYYQEEAGFLRVDPTSAVNPNRVTRSMRAGPPEDVALPLLGGAISGLPLIERLIFYYDAAGYLVTLAIDDFSAITQRSLLEALGLPGQRFSTRLLLFVVVASTILLCLPLAYRAVRFCWEAAHRALTKRRARTDQDALLAAYARFCTALERTGLPRAPSEGPLDYAERVIWLRPDLQPETVARLRALSRDYAQLRYGPRAATPERIRVFARQVARFTLPTPKE